MLIFFVVAIRTQALKRSPWMVRNRQSGLDELLLRRSSSRVPAPGIFHKNHQGGPEGRDVLFITHMGGKLQQQPLELQEKAHGQRPQRPAKFYAHKQMEGLSLWGEEERLLRQMGASKVCCLVTGADNVPGSKHCWMLFAYCLPSLLAQKPAVFWVCGRAMFWINPTWTEGPL